MKDDVSDEDDDPDLADFDSPGSSHSFLGFVFLVSLDMKLGFFQIWVYINRLIFVIILRQISSLERVCVV